MKNATLLFTLFIFYSQFVSAQIKPVEKDKTTYSTYLDAVNNPENVVRLKLNNLQEIKAITDWSKLKNIEYLSLENDHLTEFPIFITSLKNLKVIDLSGNDFEQLPNEFTKLKNLEEVFLNNEKQLNLPKTLNILSKLPKLKSLHLENDGIEILPEEIFKLKNLESLYLTNNKLFNVPKLDTLKHLKYLDLKQNNIKPEFQELKNLNFGTTISF